MNAARWFVCQFPPMAWMLFEDEPCQPDNFRCNRVCPRIAKAEFGRRFFSGNFRWCFNGGAKWITQLAGVFPVGVVNAPQLIARLRSHGCAHVWQFTRNRLCEDVSATQNARTVRGMSEVWSVNTLWMCCEPNASIGCNPVSEEGLDLIFTLTLVE